MSQSLSEGEAVGPQDDLETLRKATLKDAGPVQRLVSVKLFFAHVLPPLHKTLKDGKAVKRVLAHLQSGPDKIYTGKDWGNIVKKQAAKKKEKDIYAGMEAISQAIQDAVEAIDLPNAIKPTTTYRDAPNVAPVSLTRTATHKPDGYFRLCEPQESEDVDHWMDIASVGEFKRKDNREAVNADIRQLLWDLQHILREDERRRFTYGFNIEKKDMRLWFISRSDILVCEAFDIVKYPSRLIHFFLAFMYSSLTRLGWDTTMEYVRGEDSEDGQRHLLITTQSKQDQSTTVYRTLELLSNVGTEAICGRGTRVWRVEGVSKNGQPIPARKTSILKDLWLDIDRELEGDILAKVRIAAAQLEPELRAILESALLTVETYGDVFITPDDSDPQDAEPYLDQTLSQETRDLVWPPGGPVFELQKPAIMDRTEQHLSRLQSQAAGNENSVHKQPDPLQRLITHHPKKHTRIVFYEDCRPIHEERSLDRALIAIGKTCKALRALHHAGWVHRDISGGNILVWGDEVKLADFEYAKEFREMKTAKELLALHPHPIRTGTPDYVSVEVVQEEFCFLPRRNRFATVGNPPKPSEQGNQPMEQPSAEDSASTQASQPDEQMVWQYYPMNDIESLKWLFDQLTVNRDIYFTRKPFPDKEVYCPEGFEPAKDRTERVKRQADAALAFTYGHPERTSIMTLTNSSFFNRALANLHPILRPRDPQNHHEKCVAWALKEFRELLQSAYEMAEQDPSAITNLSAEPLYQPLVDTIHAVRSTILMDNYLVCIRPLGPEIHKIRVAEQEKLSQKPAAQRPTQTPKPLRKAAAPTAGPSNHAPNVKAAAATKRKRRRTPKAGPSRQLASEPSDSEDSEDESPSEGAHKRKKKAKAKKT